MSESDWLQVTEAEAQYDGQKITYSYKLFNPSSFSMEINASEYAEGNLIGSLSGVIQPEEEMVVSESVEYKPSAIPFDFGIEIMWVDPPSHISNGNPIQVGEVNKTISEDGSSGTNDGETNGEGMGNLPLLIGAGSLAFFALRNRD